jgi:hypothetical protein
MHFAFLSSICFWIIVAVTAFTAFIYGTVFPKEREPEDWYLFTVATLALLSNVLFATGRIGILLHAVNATRKAEGDTMYEWISGAAIVFIWFTNCLAIPITQNPEPFQTLCLLCYSAWIYFGYGILYVFYLNLHTNSSSPQYFEFFLCNCSNRFANASTPLLTPNGANSTYI